MWIIGENGDSRKRWTPHGHLLGRPVYYVEREQWPGGIAELDGVLRTAGYVTSGEE